MTTFEITIHWFTFIVGVVSGMSLGLTLMVMGIYMINEKILEESK